MEASELKTKYNQMREEYKKNLLFTQKYTDEVKNSPYFENEKKANRVFQKLLKSTQTSEIEERFHFHAIDYFNQVKNLSFYKLIHEMPKGGLMHHHLIVHAGPKYFADLIIEEEYSYVDLKQGICRFFYETKEVPLDYVKLKGNKEITPEQIHNLFYFDHEDKLRPDYWMHFDRKIFNMNAITSNSKYFRDYLLKIFNDSIDEGILIYQGRHYFGMINEYGKNWSLSPEEELEIFLGVLEEVRKREPLFQANLIYIAFRKWDLKKIEEEMEKCLALKKMKREYDEIILGFDLVGDELLQESKQFADLLFSFQERVKKESVKFEFYLHSGEPISHTNDNLVDSILLKTPRIGHGTNLINHLYLLPDVKKLNMCLECNPLSNQILNYIPDLRDHPAKKLLDAGFAVTISSDDDGVWNTESLIVFDFFICAVSMNFDLFDFKQTAIHSINHSGIPKEKLEAVKAEFLNRWNLFIEKIISSDN